MSLEAQAVKGPATAGEAAVAALEVVEVPMAPSAPVAPLVVGGKKETTKAGAKTKQKRGADGVGGVGGVLCGVDGGLYPAVALALGFTFTCRDEEEKNDEYAEDVKCGWGHAGVVPAGMYSTVFDALRYQHDNDADSTGSTGSVAAAFTAMDEVKEGREGKREGAGKDTEAEDIAEDTCEFGGELRCCICLEGFEAGDTLRKVRRAREKRYETKTRTPPHQYRISNQSNTFEYIPLSYSASLPRSSFAPTFLLLLFAVASVRALFSLRVHLAMADILLKLVPNRSPSCHWGRHWKHRRYPHNYRSHNSSDGEGG